MPEDVHAVVFHLGLFAEPLDLLAQGIVSEGLIGVLYTAEDRPVG